jgi:hypothetical protein
MKPIYNIYQEQNSFQSNDPFNSSHNTFNFLYLFEDKYQNELKNIIQIHNEYEVALNHKIDENIIVNSFQNSNNYFMDEKENL